MQPSVVLARSNFSNISNSNQDNVFLLKKEVLKTSDYTKIQWEFLTLWQQNTALGRTFILKMIFDHNSSVPSLLKKAAQLEQDYCFSRSRKITRSLTLVFYASLSAARRLNPKHCFCAVRICPLSKNCLTLTNLFRLAEWEYWNFTDKLLNAEDARNALSSDRVAFLPGRKGILAIQGQFLDGLPLERQRRSERKENHNAVGPTSEFSPRKFIEFDCHPEKMPLKPTN